jgi:hypothetical protein
MTKARKRNAKWQKQIEREEKIFSSTSHSAARSAAHEDEKVEFVLQAAASPHHAPCIFETK